MSTGRKNVIHKYSLGEQTLGIVVYKTNLTKQIADLIECEIHLSQSPLLKWSVATVGFNQVPSTDYRDCVDWKIAENRFGELPFELQSACAQVAQALRESVNDYTAVQNIHPMEYMEALNFVRYGVNQHFAPHNDHGYTYVCAVSTVLFLNDDFNGGELEFTKLGIKIKPNEGDLVVFPSNFIYTHTSRPVKTGVKYSVVTMFDYNDRCHKGFSNSDTVNTKGENSIIQPDSLCGSFATTNALHGTQ